MSTKTKSQNAVALLKEDHRKVKQLFSAFEKAEDAAEQKSIAEEAMKELRIHSVVEEEIFYPAVRAALGEDGSEVMDESEEEHRVAKTIIEELTEGKTSDEHFEAKFMVLAEAVRHHIKEEESEMFKKARSADDLDLDELGATMLERKQSLEENESELSSAEESSHVKPYQELALTH